jgi:hypothetical protein
MTAAEQLELEQETHAVIQDCFALGRFHGLSERLLWTSLIEAAALSFHVSESEIAKAIVKQLKHANQQKVALENDRKGGKNGAGI